MYRMLLEFKKELKKLKCEIYRFTPLLIAAKTKKLLRLNLIF